ncbi:MULTISPECIES: hypothetical protein [unclassified Mycobacterium]|uniref:hypothetical protein n=1 Tax=unclassified Mycobacterium TaxID=2642494 RepID=UPI00048B6F7A|nr:MULTISPECIES: hypothetical protein [unclassified Mycobacterium]SEB02043.1 hypothetical protein SAMN04488580_10672 [Mycobacterium sp. 283mftsu]
MAEHFVLQKLLAAPVSSAIVENGLDQVGGYVTEASAVVGLRTPAELLAAYGIDAAPDFADVVRFEQPRLATFTKPSDAERPWRDFPQGFLLGGSLAPVWRMSRTRFSYGAEYWRIRSDGEQKRLSRYEGAARGWVGAKRWRPPSPIVGTLARWQGREYFADVIAENVLLTALTENGPAGFEPVRPHAWSATVPVAECEVFERVFTAQVDGVPVRILRRAGETAEVLLLSDDPADAERVGAGRVEAGVFEAVVAANRLADVHGVDNQWVPGADK